MPDFAALLQGATQRISSVYFDVPVDGGGPVYRERVYCYELYHQLRNLLVSGDPTLHGELDKSGHTAATSATRRKKPDFVFHEPGHQTGNKVIVEVKNTRARKADLKADLVKLVSFCEDPILRYRRAIYLIYGRNAGVVADKAMLLSEFSPKIEVWAHVEVGQPATRCDA